MKLKTFFAAASAAFIIACSSPYQATDSGVIVAPATTQEAFLVQYPGSSNVVWSYYDPGTVIINDWELLGWRALDANDYVVRFDMDGENYYAWYDADGTWIGTAYVVRDFNSLPSAINTTLQSKYPGYTISSVNREIEKGRMAYEVTLKSTDKKMVVLLDDYGNVIKSKERSL